MALLNEINYVNFAESVIEKIKDKDGNIALTTSKIRKLLSMSADIYNEVIIYNDEVLSDEIIGRIEYLRMNFMYEAGRDVVVKDFVIKSKASEILKEVSKEKSKKYYLLFNKYMEAIVAFHKFNNGRD